MRRKNTIEKLLDSFINNRKVKDNDIEIIFDHEISAYTRLLIDGLTLIKRRPGSESISIYHYVNTTKSRNIIKQAVEGIYGFDVRFEKMSDFIVMVISDKYHEYRWNIDSGMSLEVHKEMLYVREFTRNVPISGYEDICSSAAFYNFINSYYSESVILNDLRHKQTCELTNKINFIDVSKDDPSKLSYLDERKYNQLHEPTRDDLYTENVVTRYHAKPAKAIRKLLDNPDKYTAQDYEKFTRLWNLKFNPLANTKLVVVEPSEIPALYHNSNYGGRGGTLWGSCMIEKSENFFEIYKDNCSGMLVMTDDDKILGRALLWKTDCGTNIMDRVYYTTEDVKEAFLHWAKDNNFTRKRCQSHSDREDWVSPEGQEFDEDYEITLKKTDYNTYPYADTFAYKCGDVLSNSYTDPYDTIELISLSGGYEELNENSTRCYNCNTILHEDERLYSAYEGDNYCGDCASYSEEENDVVPHDSGVYSNYHKDWIFEHHSSYSEDMDTHFLTECDDFIYVKMVDDSLHIDDVVHLEYRDEYARTIDCVESEWEDETILTNDATEVVTPEGGSDWILTTNAVFSKQLDKHIIESVAVEVNGEYIYEQDNE